jgi:hypothetical protein
LQRLQKQVAELLEDEFLHRAGRGHPLPPADDPEAVAMFIDRAAQLKKHFHEVLYLEAESTMIDQKWRDAVGVGGAAAAFVGYFVLNMLQTNAAARAGLGLGTVLTLGAIAYALKDRMKELTRAWLAGKLSHLYANRVITLRAPARLCPERPVVMQSRETFAQTRLSRPDPLNPAVGEGQRVVELRYRQRPRVRRADDANLSTFDRVKIVFRYDLSPLFSRLDDSVKRVPVAGSGRVKFADAPRLYRFPVTLTARFGREELRIGGTVLVQKNGIERILIDEAPKAAEVAAAGAAIAR